MKWLGHVVALGLLVAIVLAGFANTARRKAVPALSHGHTAAYWHYGWKRERSRRLRAESALQRRGVALAQVRQLGTPESAIEYVFGGEAEHAKTVARCETGDPTLRDVSGDLRAGLGKHAYVGVFQMEAWERRAYGVGSYREFDSFDLNADVGTVLDQVLSAFRMWALRRDPPGWLPWQCKETGGLRW